MCSTAEGFGTVRPETVVFKTKGVVGVAQAPNRAPFCDAEVERRAVFI